MVTTEEGVHRVDDGAELYTKTWKPNGPVLAKLAFVHGFSDHCNTFDEFFTRLASRGIEVHGFDGRGWGRSVHTPSEKGLTGPTARVLADITSFLTSLLPSSIPLFLMGASMGGAEVLHYAASGPSSIRRQIRGYLTDAPFVALHPRTRPWTITVILGRLAVKLMPHYQMVNKLDYTLLSRDPEVVRQMAEDPLCHDTGTLEGLAGMLDRAAELESGRVRVSGEEVRSVWMSHGTEDQICDIEATRKAFERMEVRDKEFKVYEGWYHCLHREIGECAEIYANDVADWILARSGDESGSGNVSSAKPKL